MMAGSKADTKMKYTLKYILPLMFLAFSGCDNNDINKIKGESSIVFPKGEKITNENFTGTAYLQMLIASDSLNQSSVGPVTFEPGARSNWHLHPAGQILLVIDGVGYYQEKGQPKKVLRKGDAIKCPANIQHWHGASAGTSFVQVAITSNQNGPVQWFNKVSDEEYLK